MSEEQIEEQILTAGREKPEGISNSTIQQLFPDIQPATWTKVMNKLLKNNVFELFKDQNELLYKFKDPSQKSTVKGSDNEERVVFKIIEEADNKGIWIRDIRFKSNLNMTQLNKVLKSLETKKIIKAVKSVSASKKKVYMLYELEPDSSVTGGAWYQDQDFESEFVDVLNQQCHRFLVERWENAVSQGGGPVLIRNRSYATASDVHKFISDLGISKVALTVEDMESILYTVVLDNKAERIINSSSLNLYRAVNPLLPSTGLVKSNCGICPIANRCADTGLVTPKVCNYLNDWLEN